MKPHFFSFTATMLVFTAVLLSGCKEEKKDTDITEAVRSTTSVIDKNIVTEVKDGVVTMKGDVADEATKTAAINAVKHIEGVSKVESYLTVKAGTKPPQMSQADIQLKGSIDSALSLQKINGVDITVTNGEVTLSGEVTRAQEVAIMKIAADAHPSRLTNYLTVTDKEK